jgi:broad specificity phosphatase PhoE
MTSLRPIALAAAFLIATPIVAAAQQTTVILVRHAEKDAAGGSDPALSEAGRERARALARELADDSVTAIVVTPFARTNETAAPLARTRNVTPHVVPVAGELSAHVAAAVAAVRAHAGGKVLVVGHSNTVPALIAALGGPAVTITDAEYANFFTIILDPKGAAVFTRACYGAPDTAGSCVAK